MQQVLNGSGARNAVASDSEPGATAADTWALQRAIERTCGYLLATQLPSGCWQGELEADISVTAGYVSFMRYFGFEIGERADQVRSLLLREQLPNGGWSAYAGGGGHLDVSVQVYLALKLLGCGADEPFVRRARDFIVAQGGVERCATFTRILLALFGQVDWDTLPMVPPEIMRLPRISPITIYDFSSWARATIVALTIVFAHRPVYPFPPEEGVQELYARPGYSRAQHWGPRPRPGPFTWGRMFLIADRLLKLYERQRWHPGRQQALREAERWVLAHQDSDGSWGGIMLPWLYSLVALKCLGYSNDHPVMAKGLAGLEQFIVTDGPYMRLQPAVSPVWDTAYALLALREASLSADHPALTRGADWLLDRQILTRGDWQVKRPHAVPGGWAFELVNEQYPDIDDTALVPIALQGLRLPDEERKRAACERAIGWLLAMQSRNGGWAAFDVDNDKRILAHIPFADFVTPLDPPSADVTAHASELLARMGADYTQPALQQALRFLYDEQEPDGAWVGRWGVNYIYGTGTVLMALRAAGEDMQAKPIQRAARWLATHQNLDGGWGETCHSYEDDRLRGHGPSTASQTAWALLGLLACQLERDPMVRRGIAYLINTQSADGQWDEAAFTGTGFPCAFYLRYHMYSIHFPLIALARYARAIGSTTKGDGDGDEDRHM